MAYVKRIYVTRTAWIRTDRDGRMLIGKPFRSALKGFLFFPATGGKQ